jgi:hypothetical protein
MKTSFFFHILTSFVSRLSGSYVIKTLKAIYAFLGKLQDHWSSGCQRAAHSAT